MPTASQPKVESLVSFSAHLVGGELQKLVLDSTTFPPQSDILKRIGDCYINEKDTDCANLITYPLRQSRIPSTYQSPPSRSMVLKLYIT